MGYLAPDGACVRIQFSKYSFPVSKRIRPEKAVDWSRRRWKTVNLHAELTRLLRPGNDFSSTEHRIALLMIQDASNELHFNASRGLRWKLFYFHSMRCERRKHPGLSLPDSSIKSPRRTISLPRLTEIKQAKGDAATNNRAATGITKFVLTPGSQDER